MKILDVPYFKQLDNEGGQGYRECFSSSCAMLAAYYGAVDTDDEYNRRRRNYGDSTSIQAQLSTLRSLGLRPIFSRFGSRGTIEKYIGAGNPIAVGWLHKGRVTSPWGGGHWSVVVGYDKLATIQHDPYGEAMLVGGGYNIQASGKGLRYSWRNWHPRWCVENNNSGWYVVCI